MSTFRFSWFLKITDSHVIADYEFAVPAHDLDKQAKNIRIKEIVLRFTGESVKMNNSTIEKDFIKKT